MKLLNAYDVKEFVYTIWTCERDVLLVTPDGKEINLKCEAEMDIAVGLLVGVDGDAMEIFATTRQDEDRLLKFLIELDKRHTNPESMVG